MTNEQWANLVRVAVRGVTNEQARAIAARCAEAEQHGGNCAVWHQSALFFNNACNCHHCRIATLEPKQ